MLRRRSAALALGLFFAQLASPLLADSTPHVLAGGSFSQDWSNAGLITVNDDWSGVPSILGYLGDSNAGSPTNVDPQTLLLDFSATQVDVIANQTNPNTLTNGGVAEFDIVDDTVALNGSGTADAPFLLLHLDTTGCSNIQVSYNLRDLDGSIDNSVQQFALHYRVGAGTGAFSNIDDGYVADATSGPSQATLVTPVSQTLPAAANNQPLVLVRILTTNAAGNDEWVGVDDIVVSGSCVVGCQLTCPPNQQVGTDFDECVAAVTYPPPTTSGSCGPVVCTPPSGSNFILGTTPVSCVEQPQIPFGTPGPAQCAFNVTVVDDEAPTVDAPDVTVPNAAGLCSATVTFNATANDNCLGDMAAVCTPPSGSTFPVGTTAGNCTATDGAGNTGSDGFNVTVQDTEAPVVVAGDLTVASDPGLCSAVVNVGATATDNCDGALAPVCSPPSGGAFPVGTTSGSCAASDGAGNQGSDPFDVTVNDVEPPVLTCSPDLFESTAPGETEVVVDFADAAVADNCAGPGAAVCAPPSGSSFPVGVTPVDCAASDAAGNTASCGFNVTVGGVTILEVPTLSQEGLVALLLAFAGAALLRLRRGR